MSLYVEVLLSANTALLIYFYVNEIYDISQAIKKNGKSYHIKVQDKDGDNVFIEFLDCTEGQVKQFKQTWQNVYSDYTEEDTNE